MSAAPSVSVSTNFPLPSYPPGTPYALANYASYCYLKSRQQLEDARIESLRALVAYLKEENSSVKDINRIKLAFRRSNDSVNEVNYAKVRVEEAAELYAMASNDINCNSPAR
jgi:hypothetical protein